LDTHPSSQQSTTDDTLEGDFADLSNGEREAQTDD
jgi:hypothetical protein